jgi:hypothetical protein
MSGPVSGKRARPASGGFVFDDAFRELRTAVPELDALSDDEFMVLTQGLRRAAREVVRREFDKAVETKRARAS